MNSNIIDVFEYGTNKKIFKRRPTTFCEINMLNGNIQKKSGIRVEKQIL